MPMVKFPALPAAKVSAWLGADGQRPPVRGPHPIRRSGQAGRHIGRGLREIPGGAAAPGRLGRSQAFETK
jgi:hypothetical protein